MSDLVGSIVAERYRVDQFLGRGGMADVYKVWDSQRAAALAMKVLHENLAEDQVFLRRFRREAQNLAKLKHPNIVRFYELDQDGELVFMIMEYVDGVTLSKARSRSQSPFTPGQTLSIIQPICSALHFAHQLGLVHCDIKPANIMIDRTSRVLLTDFGIARVTEGATTATMVGAGTPAYMSPEQVKGDDPTAQTDIYSLGVVMYELLTGGERPFTGEHATITGTIGEKIRWEQRKLAPPSPRIHNPNIPAEVEEVVLRCMAKDRKKRYLSVNNLLEALGKAVGAEPESLPTMVFGREEVRSAVQKPPSRRRKTLQTSPVYYVGAAVAGIGLLLGLMSAGKGGGEDPPYPGNPSPVVITSIVEVEVTAAENPVVKIEPTRAPPTDTPPPTFTPIPSLSVYTERTSSGIFLKVTGGAENYNNSWGPFPNGEFREGPNDNFAVYVDIEGNVWLCRYGNEICRLQRSLKREKDLEVFITGGATPEYDLSYDTDDNGTYRLWIFERNWNQTVVVKLSRDYTLK